VETIVEAKIISPCGWSGLSDVEGIFFERVLIFLALTTDEDAPSFAFFAEGGNHVSGSCILRIPKLYPTQNHFIQILKSFIR
jgi:hypothetical protein